MLGGQIRARHREPAKADNDCILRASPPASHISQVVTASRPYSVKRGSGSLDESGWEEFPQPPGLWLTDMGLSGVSTIRFDLHGSKLDVNHTDAGIGEVLYWQGTIAEIALYERLDPGKPTWKLVGVFPVSDGFAQLDLEKLEGKGQTGDTALYIASDESRAAQCVPAALLCAWTVVHQQLRVASLRPDWELVGAGSWMKKLLGGGWSSTIVINREEEITWQVPSIAKSVRG